MEIIYIKVLQKQKRLVIFVYFKFNIVRVLEFVMIYVSVVYSKVRQMSCDYVMQNFKEILLLKMVDDVNYIYFYF